MKNSLSEINHVSPKIVVQNMLATRVQRNKFQLRVIKVEFLIYLYRLDQISIKGKNPSPDSVYHSEIMICVHLVLRDNKGTWQFNVSPCFRRQYTRYKASERETIRNKNKTENYNIIDIVNKYI